MRYNALKTNMFLSVLAKHVPGTYNTSGDLASGSDTVCDSVLCNNNYYVSDHKCIVCAPGKYNAAGDDVVGPDTVCDTIQCAENEYVSDHNLPSMSHEYLYPYAAGDLSGSDTVCDGDNFVTITTELKITNV